jgi:hypothetical protein
MRDELRLLITGKFASFENLPARKLFRLLADLKVLDRNPFVARARGICD